ncbi:MAG TPA: TOBE domain-containing protein [Acidimicrobiales bacterium]|nr:TOBE domain-containing protein [Acidimicrobiales bacterium]
MLRPAGLRVGARATDTPNIPLVKLSARNQLEGVVTRVDHGAVMSTVVVRLAGGQEVVSAITRDSAETLALAEGDDVKAVIKATEVMIAKD